MKLMQLTQLDKRAIKTVKASFDNLPHTDHKDGKFRLRRYSRVELRRPHQWRRGESAGSNIEITDLNLQEFTQSSDYNLHQGDQLRKFENIEESTMNTEGFKKICSEFKKANDLKDGMEVDVHQLRVVTLAELNNTAPVAPEGRHQDGYDYIAMVGIQRSNIYGGELMAYGGDEDQPFLSYALREGQMLFLADKVLWHYATDIVRGRQELGQGYGDWFVLCANK